MPTGSVMLPVLNVRWRGAFRRSIIANSLIVGTVNNDQIRCPFGSALISSSLDELSQLTTLLRYLAIDPYRLNVGRIVCFVVGFLGLAAIFFRFVRH
jgi:hypothetical protein